jgi:hypothetical protein
MPDLLVDPEKCTTPKNIGRNDWNDRAMWLTLLSYTKKSCAYPFGKRTVWSLRVIRTRDLTAFVLQTSGSRLSIPSPIIYFHRSFKLKERAVVSVAPRGAGWTTLCGLRTLRPCSCPRARGTLQISPEPHQSRFAKLNPLHMPVDSMPVDSVRWCWR